MHQDGKKTLQHFKISIVKIIDDCLGAVLSPSTSFGSNNKSFYKLNDANNLLQKWATNSTLSIMQENPSAFIFDSFVKKNNTCVDKCKKFSYDVKLRRYRN
jgi:hypothetical protein